MLGSSWCRDTIRNLRFICSGKATSYLWGVSSLGLTFIMQFLHYVHVRIFNVHDKVDGMIKISATKFRNNLFDYLNKVSEGETIVIQRNNQDVAKLISPSKGDWRDHMKVQPKLLVSPEQIILPLEDIWERYI